MRTLNPLEDPVRERINKILIFTDEETETVTCPRVQEHQGILTRAVVQDWGCWLTAYWVTDRSLLGLWFLEVLRCVKHHSPDSLSQVLFPILCHFVLVWVLLLFKIS